MFSRNIYDVQLMQTDWDSTKVVSLFDKNAAVL